jgi:hypothetical protein
MASQRVAHPTKTRTLKPKDTAPYPIYSTLTELLLGLVVFAAIPLVPYLTVLSLKDWRKHGRGQFLGE